MRTVFFEKLYEAGRQDPRVILINPDTAGYHATKFIRELPHQYINIGIAEQNSVGFAAGLALEGKIPFVFNILTFAALRCYEQIRLDVCSMNLPVTIVGVGAGFDYCALGPSHQATEDIAAMRVLPEISVYSPSDDRLAEMLVPHCVKEPGPKYLRLDRTGTPLLYKDELPDLSSGFQELITGRDVCIVATGRMVFQAMAVAEALKRHSIEAGVMDLFRIKPFPEDALCRALSKSRQIATLEEHFVTGGIGTAVLEALSNQGLQKPVLRLGIPGRFCRVYGDRQYLHKENHLDAETLVEKLVSFVRKDGGIQVGENRSPVP